MARFSDNYKEDIGKNSIGRNLMCFKAGLLFANPVLYGI